MCSRTSRICGAVGAICSNEVPRPSRRARPRVRGGRPGSRGASVAARARPPGPADRTPGDRARRSVVLRGAPAPSVGRRILRADGAARGRGWPVGAADGGGFAGRASCVRRRRRIASPSRHPGADETAVGGVAAEASTPLAAPFPAIHADANPSEEIDLTWKALVVVSAVRRPRGCGRRSWVSASGRMRVFRETRPDGGAARSRR